MEKDNAEQVDLEYWMRDLPPQLKDVPLIYLAIPGSHDSMTYGITRSSGLAPDAEPILHRLYPLFRGTILRWTITQALDVHQQLLIGIRYFDLRIATKNGTNSFYFTHGVYADEITKPLEHIKEFMHTHPDEVVILDCQHFYGFDIEDHKRLMFDLLKMFGNRLVPRQIDLQQITLNSLRRLGQQPPGIVEAIQPTLVILNCLSGAGDIGYARFVSRAASCLFPFIQVVVVYRHQSVYTNSEFWQPQMMPSPWPRQDRTAGLIQFLDNVKRHPGMGFVHQAVLTPTPTFIILRWLSNLREKCAVPVKERVLPKLLELWPGPPLARGSAERAPVNVVIADFVDMDNALFPRRIIELNFKLLRNTDTVYHSYG